MAVGIDAAEVGAGLPLGALAAPLLATAEVLQARIDVLSWVVLAWLPPVEVEVEPQAARSNPLATSAAAKSVGHRMFMDIPLVG